MTSTVHPVDERLPLLKLFPLALQHVLVMYAGAVAVPLIIGRALKLSPQDVAFLISADLFACGIATLVQSVGLPGIGIRLPVMMGVTFASVGPMLAMAASPEIGLLGISASQASEGLSPFAILVFPALFTAGMALVDTTDGVFMVGAYGWAFVNPMRKLWYNLTITAVSVLVALLIGGIEALGLLAAKLNLAGSFWTAVAALNDDLASFGFIVVGLFIVSWIVSAMIYRWSRYGEILARAP